MCPVLSSVGGRGVGVAGDSARQLLIDVNKIFITCHIELLIVWILGR